MYDIMKLQVHPISFSSFNLNIYIWVLVLNLKKAGKLPLAARFRNIASGKKYPLTVYIR
jgi:hypothetical protein